jgi:hypothetical protein
VQEMVKVDGVWKLNMALPEALLGQMKMMKPMLDNMSGAMDAVAGKTKKGEYATGDEMVQDLMKQMMESMMGGGKPADGDKKPGG